MNTTTVWRKQLVYEDGFHWFSSSLTKRHGWLTSAEVHAGRLSGIIPGTLVRCFVRVFVAGCCLVNLLLPTFKTVEQRTIIQQYGDWYTGR